MNGEHQYLRGAFIAYEPGGYPDKGKTVIPFRFNPEGLTRQLQVEQGKSASGTEGAKPSGGAEQAADASTGALKEGFSVLLRFDLDDRLAFANSLPPALGVAPELAALENLLYPVEAPHEKASDGKEGVKQRSQRPTVLFVWGRRRVLPVRITQITVNETLHNAELMPVRAEAEVQCEVLSDVDAKDNRAVQEALRFTDGKRRELAKLYADKTVDQGTTILPL